MLQIKQWKQKAGLTEKDSSFGKKMEKENSCSVEARSQKNVQVDARSGYVEEYRDAACHCGQNAAGDEVGQKH